MTLKRVQFSIQSHMFQLRIKNAFYSTSLSNSNSYVDKGINHNLTNFRCQIFSFVIITQKQFTCFHYTSFLLPLIKNKILRLLCTVFISLWTCRTSFICRNHAYHFRFLKYCLFLASILSSIYTSKYINSNSYKDLRKRFNEFLWSPII